MRSILVAGWLVVGAYALAARTATSEPNPPEPVLDKWDVNEEMAALSTEGKALKDDIHTAQTNENIANKKVERVVAEVKQDYGGVYSDSAVFQGALNEANDNNRIAGKYLSLADKQEESTRELIRAAPGRVKALASKKVLTILRQEYDRLHAWRKQYLSNPYEKAAKAAKEAALPYNDAIRALYGRLGEYTLNAGIYAGAAKAAQSAGEGLAAGAQGKISGGDVIGAELDMAEAQSKTGHAASLAGAANGLQGQADGINKLIPEYIAQGYQAAWRKAYETDPQFVPPPPYNPNYAFAPKSLLQKSATAKHEA